MQKRDCPASSTFKREIHFFIMISVTDSFSKSTRNYQDYWFSWSKNALGGLIMLNGE